MRGEPVRTRPATVRSALSPSPRSPLSPMLRPMFLACGVACRLCRASVRSVGGAPLSQGSLWPFRLRSARASFVGVGTVSALPLAVRGTCPLRGALPALARRARSRSRRTLPAVAWVCRAERANLARFARQGNLYYKIDFLRQYEKPTLKQC